MQVIIYFYQFDYDSQIDKSITTTMNSSSILFMVVID